MAHINALRSNNLSVVSTFSGCGGSCLGYKMAGYDVIYANDMSHEARQSYAANFPDTYVDTKNIRDVNGKDILNQMGLQIGDVDLFYGSPPCQSFSMSGKRSKGWGQNIKHSDGTEQVSDDLFFEYIRLIDELRPKTFLAENVEGLCRGVAKGYFKYICQAMRDIGYVVHIAIVNAKYLAVPQNRPRTIFVGIRSDVATVGQYRFPKPMNHMYSIRDALPWITSDESTQKQAIQKIALDDVDAEFVSLGKAALEAWKNTQVGRAHKTNFNCVRCHPEKQSPTILAFAKSATAHGVCHPVHPRRFTIAELKKICGFPDDFILCGDFKTRWARLGNAVPPPMMYYLSKSIRDQILLPHYDKTYIDSIQIPSING